MESQAQVDVAPPSPTSRRRWPTRIVAGCVWLYVAAILIAWLLLRLGGDRWWFATLMLFGPKWAYSVPLLALVPAALFARRRLLWPLGAAAIVAVGPLMGLCLPWARLAAPSGPSLRVLTCNLKGRCSHNAVLDELINTALPDVVTLQGCWGNVQIRWPTGWHVRQEAGLLIASRYPLLDQGTVHSWRPPEHWQRTDMFHCAVQTPHGDVDFCSVHLVSPHRGIDAVLDRKTVVRPSDSLALASDIELRWQESEGAADWVATLYESPILAGDFNLPVDSAIYREHWAGYRDAFSEAGLGFGYTERPRVHGFSWGVRIDHVLTGSNWRCRSCWVGPDVGSDHLPLVADLVWDAASPQ